jgi:7,8-dihydropterin-6-yl-methyl-4-(beta-D-ribofuranosyl)aminobenzene 5'-phosphate synthase
MKVTIVYNNVDFDSQLETDWGMSAVVETPKTTILFDTGANGKILLSNMEKLKIDPAEIDIVVVSHNHWDHTGGLEEFLSRNHNVTVFVPASARNSLGRIVERHGAKMVAVSNATKICDSIYTTGELGAGIKEQALIIESKSGLIIVDGCSHPGVVNIARAAKNFLNKDIYFITGGFHLGGSTKSEIDKIADELSKMGVKKIGSSHCTGAPAMEAFKEALGENFIDAGCGAVIDIP